MKLNLFALALAPLLALFAGSTPAHATGYGHGGNGNFRTFNTYSSYGYASPVFVTSSFCTVPVYVTPSYVVPSVTYAVPATSYGVAATNTFIVPATVATTYGYPAGFSVTLFNGSFYHAGTGVYVGNAFNTHLHSMHSAGHLSRR